MLRSICTVLGCFCGIFFAIVLSPATSIAEERVDFNRDIRPILSDTCYKCHGPDEKERQAGLRLDIHEGAMATLESGARAVVPGKLDESELVARISTTSEDDRMPPVDSGRKLLPRQIELLRNWVAQGAEWKRHWSLIKPERPALPEVRESAFVKNPLDRFVLARLEQEGLAPTTEADKVTLIRRVTFDLTGLPPTPAEVDAFLADDAPDAYERVVDRLLKSTHYGEQMARYWLDAARYGDTHGLHFDNERAIWKYREWVIDAFNENKPFDQFTIEQLAGDLLPDATLEQRIATGFNRCNVSTSEGGSINEEVLVRYAVDRVETTATAWLGLTLGCAVCHDHKFDPITQKEFYQFFAFFNASADAAMDGNAIAPAPIVKAPEPEQTALLKQLDEQLAAARQQLADALANVEYTEPDAATESVGTDPQEFVWIEDAAPPGANLQGSTPWEFVTAPEQPVFSGQKSSRRSATGLSQHFFDGVKPGLKIGEGDKLFAHVYLDPANPPQTIMLQFNDGSWEHRAFWGEDLIPWGATGSASRLAMGPLPQPGQWVRLEVDAAKVGLSPGALVGGWAFTQHDGTVYWDKAGIVTRTPQDGQSFQSQLAWEAYERAQSKSSLPQPVLDAVKVDSAARNEAQQKLVRNYFVEQIYPETRSIFDPLHQQIDALAKQRTDTENAIPMSLVMADMAQPRETFVLIRGAYDKRGEKVSADVPAALPPLPDGAPHNRLGLGLWLVDPSNPLTARVTVNRFWQQYFGRGIVKTAEDFGAQGDWPTHPALLDWLATEFMHSGWDVKHIQKLIVMSGTYRQASDVTPALVQRDPENALLARGPRFRLDAEVVRDTALAVSGLLVDELGGKSVRPYQPAGLWEAVAFQGSNTQNFRADQGEGLYRRSIYTFWKRTSPPPSLTTFDAPSRETCVVRRARTNTPLQALALMNDEQYVEAARQLAARMLTDGGSEPATQLTFGFRLATARQPSPHELDVLLKLYGEQLVHYQADPDAANKLLSIGQSPRDATLDAGGQAAMTMMANLILNLDETITKE